MEQDICQDDSFLSQFSYPWPLNPCRKNEKEFVTVVFYKANVHLQYKVVSGVGLVLTVFALLFYPIQVQFKVGLSSCCLFRFFFCFFCFCFVFFPVIDRKRKRDISQNSKLSDVIDLFVFQTEDIPLSWNKLTGVGRKKLASSKYFKYGNTCQQNVLVHVSSNDVGRDSLIELARKRRNKPSSM